MKTYPSKPVTPLSIGTVTQKLSFIDSIVFWSQGTAFQDAAFPSATTAYFYPINLPWPYLVKHFWWGNTPTAAGSVDVGVYNPNGTKIYSTGTITQSGTSTAQRVAVTNPFELDAGAYYLAITSTTSSHFWTLNSGFNVSVTATLLRLAGVVQNTGLSPSNTLPSTATFSVMSASTWPIFGMSKMPTSF